MALARFICTTKTLYLHHQNPLFNSRLPSTPLFHLTHLLLHQSPDPTPHHSASSCIPIIRSCSSHAHLLQLHAHLLRTSLIHDPAVATAFLSRAALSPHHDMNYSSLVFKQIPSHNILHCNAMIRGYSQSSNPATAFHLYADMRRHGIRPNPFSSSFVLKSCTKISSISSGKQVHCTVMRDGHHSDSFLLASLMGLYAVCGAADDAHKVFDEMPTRDTVAWNVLISCYTLNNRTKDVLQLFDVMQGPDYRSEPDDVTCLHLLQACAHLGAVDFGGRIHRYIDERGYGAVLKVRNSLIAMYSKCGFVDRAYSVFVDTPQRNVVTWTAMISGMAMNGYGRDAIEAFLEMQRVGVRPDEQTFTCVLSACSHSGLIDEGLRFYEIMREEYRLVPNVCHYGCIVDLLGRAGLLHKAYQLIVTEMVVEPDATIWRTLLGACRIHGSVELGERVVGHLIEMRAQQAGDYVLLLNIYASTSSWDKVADIRRLMKDKGIQTTPGCSTIELNGVVHEFVVDDDSHPRKAEVYQMLDEIGGQLKIAGYVANTTSELHNIDNEGKESALSYHSEKLAIAFGILSTPPGTILRVAKNLRTCADCHTFAKVLSSVYNRIIVVRDRTPFHHFREGRCSCNDYC